MAQAKAAPEGIGMAKRERGTKCDYEVFAHGTTVGIYAPNEMTADEADALCDDIEAGSPDSRADWYRYAGRIVVKVLYTEAERREYERLKKKYG